MTSPDATCWTMIRAAAVGDPAARERFGRVYLPVVKAYLAARWRAVPRPPDSDEAAQDVFVECFRSGGLLEKADPDRDGGFRAFLLGAVRNVARRHEAKKRLFEQLPADLPADDTAPAEAFDRAWARTLLKEAGRVQEERARSMGPVAVQRVQLLRLRFGEGLPIRDIAARWGEDAARLHHEYATARDEFRLALRSVVAFHHPGSPPGGLDQRVKELFGLLG
jgi:DNA-directed RNA polymerase specialized sigma24 family protein